MKAKKYLFHHIVFFTKTFVNNVYLILLNIHYFIFGIVPLSAVSEYFLHRKNIKMVSNFDLICIIR